MKTVTLSAVALVMLLISDSATGTTAMKAVELDMMIRIRAETSLIAFSLLMGLCDCLCSAT